MPRVLLGFGALLLLAAGLGVIYALLHNWVLDQDRHLLTQGAFPLPMPGGMEGASEAVVPGTALPLVGLPGGTPALASTPEPTLLPIARPPPVQIRIPAIGVTRSIIRAPRTRNGQTGGLTWNVNRLLRPGRRDQVGHLEGSANPGEAGNLVLAGHNYAYGVNGVFVRLGQLRRGQEIHIVNDEGEIFTYRVVELARVRWWGKSAEQLAKHWKYLAFDGPERLTLITCDGANFEPFPERLYVVAEPQATGTANSP